jgi:hypothetical protein
MQGRHGIHIAGKGLDQTARGTGCGTALKFGIFLHPRRPKVSVEQIATRIQSSGLLYSSHEADVAIVGGGDVTLDDWTLLVAFLGYIIAFTTLVTFMVRCRFKEAWPLLWPLPLAYLQESVGIPRTA